MGNALDYVFMESYSPTANMIKVRGSVSNVEALQNEDEYLQILQMIPRKRNFIIRDNVAISTSSSDYVENKLAIIELISLEGLNECHKITVDKDLYYLMAKANLHTSTSMF